MTRARNLRRSLGIVLSILLVVVVAGCRVPEDSSPREIPEDQVPFDLLAPPTTTPPATSPVPTVDGTVFLAQADHLVAVRRSVPAPLSLGSMLAVLMQGATSDESSQGLSSSVGPEAGVIGAQVVDGSAVIDLSAAFSGIGVREQITGLAQIVYTATEIPGVQNVRVQLNGKPASVPRGDGSATTDLLTRDAYASLAPR
jgi:hypothetical protein